MKSDSPVHRVTSNDAAILGTAQVVGGTAWFFARPEGQAQLFGSWLVVWDDLLPEYPSAVAETDSARVADALVASYGGQRGLTPG